MSWGEQGEGKGAVGWGDSEVVVEEEREGEVVEQVFPKAKLSPTHAQTLICRNDVEKKTRRHTHTHIHPTTHTHAHEHTNATMRTHAHMHACTPKAARTRPRKSKDIP